MNIAQIPDTLYTVSGRISAAQAVAGCINQMMPCGDHVRPIMDEINTLGGLADAVCDLLALLAQDVERLEGELKAA